MKIKRVLILLLVLFIPFICYAEECNKNDIKIESIELTDIRGNAEELVSPNNNNNKINLNDKMNVIGDNITYKVVVKNTSNSDYTFDKNSITKDYLSYDITYEDNSNIIKPNEEKVIYLRLSYDNKPEVESLVNGVLKENNQISFNLTKETSFINPETSNKILLSLIYLLMPVIISFYLIKKRKPAFIVLLVLTIIPYIVNASCTCVTTLDINLALEIDAKEAVFLPGTEVKAKMNDLKGGENIISSIKQSQNEPINSNKEEKNVVSTSDSEYPIYMWYEDNTIYWWSEDKTPSLNTNSSYMFSFQKNLTDISGVESFDVSSSVDLSYIFTESSLSNLKSLKNWNVSNVENLSFSFSTNKSLINLTGLENWNTSKVSDMQFLFSRCENLINMDAIKYWDVSKVNNMANLFQMNFSIEKIDLSNWETKSLEKMNLMFAMSYRGNGTTGGVLKKILLSEKFDTSKVTDMSFSFYNNQEIEDYTFTKYMDTSSVTNMQDMFYGNNNLTSLEWFKDWDVSNVKNMVATFTLNPNLKTLNGIENWNVSNVEDMSFMFSHCPLIEDASALNDWDISKVTDFTRMFFQAQDYPIFTKRQGTWQSNGTFTPTE